MRNAAIKKEMYKMAGICINRFQNKHQNKKYRVWENIQSTQYVWTLHSKNRYWCWHLTSSAQSLFQISLSYFHPHGDKNVGHCIAQVRHISNYYHSISNLTVFSRIAFYELKNIFYKQLTLSCTCYFNNPCKSCPK